MRATVSISRANQTSGFGVRYSQQELKQMFLRTRSLVTQGMVKIRDLVLM